jgi:hypothetical protein
VNNIHCHVSVTFASKKRDEKASKAQTCWEQAYKSNVIDFKCMLQGLLHFFFPLLMPIFCFQTVNHGRRQNAIDQKVKHFSFFEIL